MTTLANTSLNNPQAHAGALGHILDSFIGMIKPRQEVQQSRSSFSVLEDSFEATKGLPKSLLVVHIGTDAGLQKDKTARLVHQEKVLTQLISVFGIRAEAAPIGENEIAVLLNGIDQCSELIPRVEEMLSRISTAHEASNDQSLNYRVGNIKPDNQSSDVTMASSCLRLDFRDDSFHPERPCRLYRSHRICGQ